MQREKIITASVVDDLIANGHSIVIFEDFILQLDSWLDKHPGGRLAIMHMVGRDATDEINAYHNPTTAKAMKAFRIGRKRKGIWINKAPPIRGGTYQRLDATDRSGSTPPTSGNGDVDAVQTARFKVRLHDVAATKEALSDNAAAYITWAEKQDTARDILGYPSIDPSVQERIAREYQCLHQRVYDEGYYDCPYWEYGKDVLRYLILFAGSMVALQHQWYLASALLLGLFWHQIMFTAHDAGHRAITGSFEVDSLIGMFIGNLCCGLSIGWWKSSHNVHHLITNHPEHDPDIQNIPLFATSPVFFRGIHSSYYDFTFVWDAVGKALIPYQRYTYYPIMGIARFNLYLLSWLHVLSKSWSLSSTTAWWIRPVEVAFMSLYWYMFGYLLLWCSVPTWTMRLAYVLMSHITTMPLHIQITLSHWGMSTSALGESESFAQRQLRTTMDIACPPWLDFIHGGLQFQAIHHLFPRVPRHNLRKLQVLVREFCNATEIPYTILGFVHGNAKVLDRLEEVAEQVGYLVSCQKHMAVTGETGLA